MNGRFNSRGEYEPTGMNKGYTPLLRLRAFNLPHIITSAHKHTHNPSCTYTHTHTHTHTHPHTHTHTSATLSSPLLQARQRGDSPRLSVRVKSALKLLTSVNSRGSWGRPTESAKVTRFSTTTLITYYQTKVIVCSTF